jgi:protein involved in polysaccharide export with SLBB domain
VNVQPGPLRVTTVTAKLGEVNRGDNPVFSATSTAPAVRLSVPANQTYLVHVGDKVTVTLPAGANVNGTVVQMSAVADVTQQDNSGRQQAPTVSGLVTLDAPDVSTDLDEAPVLVNITSAAVKGVIAVPVVALVALAGGGYGVYMLNATGRHLVGVTPGLYANTLVELRDSTLHEGDKVEVPAS